MGVFSRGAEVVVVLRKWSGGFVVGCYMGRMLAIWLWESDWYKGGVTV